MRSVVEILKVNKRIDYINHNLDKKFQNIAKTNKKIIVKFKNKEKFTQYSKNESITELDFIFLKYLLKGSKNDAAPKYEIKNLGYKKDNQMVWVKELLEWEKLFLNLELQLGYYPSTKILSIYSGFDEKDITYRISIGKYQKNVLVKNSLKMIISIAKKYTGNGLSFEDLIAEGLLGLMKGIRKFDFNKGHKFSTYAHWWIRQSISRSIDDQSRVIRLPVYIRELISKINKIKASFFDKFNRAPSIKEISLITHISIDKIEKILSNCNDLVSLDSMLNNDDDESNNFLNDSLEDIKIISSEQFATENFLKKDLENALSYLSDRESAVLRLRFGLDDGNERTLEEIGEFLNVTRERARQIEIKAISKLQNNNFINLFEDYINENEM
uniref:RNA-polymerase sigma factor n=2 Tax=Amorphochlora amoebiformis TaxID=1561963 RepID=A0A0H5BR23_9EUKA|nr:RNA-polymerase sigma factor [Amorphochlora amoebiformis]